MTAPKNLNTVLSKVAKHFNIGTSLVLRIEEWANCFFVVIAGKSARFVSKSIIKTEIIQLGYVPKIVDGFETTVYVSPNNSSWNVKMYTVLEVLKEELIDGWKKVVSVKVTRSGFGD